MKKLTKKTTALIAAGALSIPLLGAVPALAQAGSADSHAQSQSSTPSTGSHQGDRRQKFEDEVAAELGVSADQLAGARKTVISRHVDQRVTNGKITAEEGQRIKDAIGTGTLRQVIRDIRQAHGK